MPLFHCSKCHHEWEAITEKLNPICDWCGAHGYVIEEKTPLERMCEYIDEVGMENFLKELEENCKDGSV